MEAKVFNAANGASIVIKLAGQLKAPKRTVTETELGFDRRRDMQSVKWSESYQEKGKWKWRDNRTTINHTNRGYQNCQRVINLERYQLDALVTMVPAGVSKRDWDKMDLTARINKALASFDEGFGVSLELC